MSQRLHERQIRVIITGVKVIARYQRASKMRLQTREWRSTMRHMAEIETSGDLLDLHKNFAGAVTRLETERDARPRVQFTGEYPLAVLADVSGLSVDVLGKVLTSNNVQSTTHGYHIDRVIGALKSYLAGEAEDVEELEGVAA